MPARLRIVFFGTPAFAVPTLVTLLDSNHEIAAVVSQPDRPRGRGQRVLPTPVKAVAVKRGVPVLQPERLSRELFEARFREIDAQLAVVAAYGKILPEWLLQAPPRGMINVHASLLPRWRGAAPVQRAVLAGDAVTGVTIMRIVKALDAGPMLARAVRPIDADEGADELERDLAQLGATVLRGVVDRLAHGPVAETPQDERLATYAPRLVKEEGRIDWHRRADALHNHVRGMRPWPTAYTFVDNVRLVVHRARPRERQHAAEAAGTCIGASRDTITVACGEDTALELLEVQLEGRRAMSAREFLAGHPTMPGQRLG